jgi:hypothetical protein
MAASDGDDVAANLSPAMLRSEMDAFLLTIGAKATPFSVSDMFAGAKHKDTWDEIVAVLQLVDAGAGGPCNFYAGAGGPRLPRRCSVLYPPSPEG